MSASLQSVISDAIQFSLNNVHTCMPGIIVDYDYKTQLATIQPAINKQYPTYPTNDVQIMPQLFNCPIIFPKCGGASLTFPVNAGDTCLILCCERSIDKWYISGGIQNPDDFRKFDLSDAVAIMGLCPQSTSFNAQNNTDVLLTYGNASLTLKQDGSIIINGSKLAIGNSSAELLDIVSQLLGYLSTSITQSSGSPIQNAAIYSSLQSLVDGLKTTI